MRVGLAAKNADSRIDSVAITRKKFLPPPSAVGRFPHLVRTLRLGLPVALTGSPVRNRAFDFRPARSFVRAPRRSGPLAGCAGAAAAFGWCPRARHRTPVRCLGPRLRAPRPAVRVASGKELAMNKFAVGLLLS